MLNNIIYTRTYLDDDRMSQVAFSDALHLGGHSGAEHGGDAVDGVAAG